MRTFERRPRPWALLLAAIAFLPGVGEARRRGLCATAAAGQAPPYVAVLSAFPAELAPLVAAADILTTVEVEGRQYYLGRLDGVSVILGLMGIGMVNATTTAQGLLRGVEVAGLVVSGVAGGGTLHRIGDVVLAADWVERNGEQVFPANPAMLALAERGAAALSVPLETCTPVPPTAVDASIVCLPFAPAIVFGGHGLSGDPFAGNAFACIPGSGEIFGCELPPAMLAGARVGATSGVMVPMVAAAEAMPDAEDMETAAVARVAAEHGVPFLGVRAMSDGAGDPLGDRGFPLQFFDYYRLAARNAAAVTRAFVAEVGRLAADRSGRRICRLLAKHRWRRAAARLQARRLRDH